MDDVPIVYIDRLYHSLSVCALMKAAVEQLKRQYTGLQQIKSSEIK